MIKLGFFTAVMKEWTFEEVVLLAADMGFPCLEVACWPAENAGKKLPGVCHIDCERICREEEYAEYVLSLTASHGIEISALTYYTNMMDPDPQKRSSAAAHLKAVIRAAARLGVNLVCAFVGRDQHKTVEENLETFCLIWPDIVAFAQDCGVKIAIENCPMLFTRDQWPGGRNLMCTPKLFKTLFEILPSPNFGLNFDPSHFVWQGLDYLAAVEEFRDRIFHVHFKDIRLYPDRLARCGVLAYPLEYMSPKIPGHGDVNWGAYVSVLNDIRYQGFGSIEMEDPAFEETKEGILDALKLSKRYLSQFLL